ncbi:MAG: hypothetical protein HGA71_18090 [Azonexaceae bacterium]|nr:hypothetical protein [Azonexaceae bacterium]
MTRRTATLLLWLSGALALGLFVAMVIHSAPLSPGIPALQFTFNEADFKAILAQWGPDGIELFRHHFLVDFPVLISYGQFGYLLVRYGCLFQLLDETTRRLSCWSMPGAAVLDAIENLLHLQLISEATSHAPALYLIAGVVATGKWLLIANFMTGALYLLAARWRYGCKK